MTFPALSRPLALASALLGLAAACAGVPRPSPASPPPAASAAARDPWPPSGPVDGPQARALVKAGAVLIDVRSEEAFEVERLPGALSLPIEELDQATELFDDRTRPLVLYCGAGIQSAAAAKRLAELGFTHVYDLGPMFGWRHGAPTP